VNAGFFGFLRPPTKEVHVIAAPAPEWSPGDGAASGQRLTEGTLRPGALRAG
jgi:hypothetical protein